jgi:hypothetical protein
MQPYSWIWFPRTKGNGPPYGWYTPLGERLWRAITYNLAHQSEAYTGNSKKKKLPWPRWRKEVARILIILDVFWGQPEYWLVGNLNLTYRQCARLRRLFIWQTRLYLWAAGFSE